MARPSYTRIGDLRRKQSDSPNGVIITRDHIIDFVSGSQFESTMATMGIPSLRASFTAIFSFLGSTTKTTPGNFFMSRMPDRFLLSLSY